MVHKVMEWNIGGDSCAAFLNFLGVSLQNMINYSVSATNKLHFLFKTASDK